MQTLTKLALPLTAIALAACGPAEGPPGPHGGENRFEVTLNGERESFDTVGLTLTQTGTSALILRANGSVDPIAEAIDDEYSLNLEVAFDPSLLAMVSAPENLPIDLTTNFEAEEFGGQRDPLVVAPSESHSPVVRSILLSKSCFCGGHPAGAQRSAGTLQIVANDAKGVQGNLQIEVDGEGPFLSQIDGSITLTFDLAPSR